MYNVLIGGDLPLACREGVLHESGGQAAEHHGEVDKMGIYEQAIALWQGLRVKTAIGL